MTGFQTHCRQRTLKCLSCIAKINGSLQCCRHVSLLFKYTRIHLGRAVNIILTLCAPRVTTLKHRRLRGDMTEVFIGLSAKGYFLFFIVRSSIYGPVRTHWIGLACSFR